ncbi:hypothetical protein Desca_2410 [Desulfotomaculum nigrificans CO-1-SRB]|uniref:Anti-sigma factor RsgI-like middle domain-containing protein n=1 Tax=Desulfotomaculum nigrificans (strain DSM 14880 / VKM B-2319 / CO-1-SRB) TaxID=868595 RepID=F6B3T0_DESCC|nr:anti-sigma factor domain-containing protein [Desulfotomaculum nigrificans]AEF95239.1 hypothetical protein Desca_2410 [Desulfotomaculum nigrificans CO-1-SRB]
MAKVKAVVMAVQDKYKNALVYTEDGQYIKTRIKPDPPLGEVVLVTTSPMLINKKFFAVAAAVMLILFAGLWPRFAPPPAAAAYLNLSLQPEIGIWVGHDGKVTRAELAGDHSFSENLKGKELYPALEQLIQYAGEQGYLKNNQDIVIGSLIRSEETSIPGIDENSLRDFLCNQFKKSGYQGAVVVTVQDGNLVKSAKNAELPLGKYIVYERCRLQNRPVSLETLRKQDISSALTEAGINARDLFGKAYVEINNTPAVQSPRDVDNSNHRPMPMHQNAEPGTPGREHQPPAGMMEQGQPMGQSATGANTDRMNHSTSENASYSGMPTQHGNHMGMQ